VTTVAPTWVFPTFPDFLPETKISNMGFPDFSRLFACDKTSNSELSLFTISPFPEFFESKFPKFTSYQIDFFVGKI
jgi:hypothetical protein